MRCEWSTLDKIETDCEKANFKNIAPMFIKFKSIYLKQVVNKKIKVWKSSMFVVRFHLLLNIHSHV